MRNPPSFTFARKTDLEKVTAAVAVHAPHALPVYRAARDGLIIMIQPGRDAQVPSKLLDQPSRPILVLISDDDYRSTGPGGWSCALRVRRWAKGAIIHAAAGEAQHYEIALAGTLLAARFVLVETSASQQSAWQALLSPKMPILNIIPRDGVHPARPAPGSLQ